MKDEKEVIQEFNELVNMTAAELETWLKSSDSEAAGLSKDGENGESIGHDSGRKIVQILKDNPKKNPDDYTEDQIQHMRKVVSYCKRHLAQESKANDEKPVEEVKKTKSYASLKNWGHDPLKERQKDTDNNNNNDEEEEEEEEHDAAGTKRAAKDNQSGENKKQKTESSAPKKAADTTKSTNKQDDQDEGSSPASDDNTSEEKAKSSDADEGASSTEGPDKDEPEKGDTVSWNWGQGQPKGKVEEVKHEKTSITTKNGNTVTRDGTSDDPAVVVDAGQSKAVKLNHELN
ncbi:DNA-binding protein [Metarhizium rileyi]|uniref:DNA-binding protein n=1 Tax=Metarhizium rileyi (strain RCEF 4871) TaxID=1649241 RepID=A0A167C1R0_METRR|nr:DNA-binding protein [Metarhizium rileyi RCEF 4871]